MHRPAFMKLPFSPEFPSTAKKKQAIAKEAMKLIKKLFVDLAFISTKGFFPAEGTFESSVATFRLNFAMKGVDNAS